MVEYLIQFAVDGVEDPDDACVLLEAEFGIPLWGLSGHELQAVLLHFLFGGNMTAAASSLAWEDSRKCTSSRDNTVVWGNAGLSSLQFRRTLPTSLSWLSQSPQSVPFYMGMWRDQEEPGLT